MELWNLYDFERNITGQTLTKGERAPKDFYRLVVHAVFFNNNNEMLIQQRQPFKEWWSNMWDLSVGGSALKGENSQTAIKREIFEELGYLISSQNIRPAITIGSKDAFDDIYIISEDIIISDLKLQESEVQRVMWSSKEYIFDLIDKEEFVPYNKSLIDLIFHLNSHPWALTKLESK